MKKLLAIWGIAVGALFSTAPASAISVYFDPSSQHVNVGDSVTVNVYIQDLGSEILSAFDLNFVYNGSLLSWTVISGTSSFAQLGGAYGADPIFVFDNVVNGNLGIQAGALEDDATVAANQLDAFLLLTFSFTALADGVTSFGLGSDADFERNFVGLDALSLNLDIGSACIAIGTGSCETTVPEPGTLGLLGLGVLGMALSRRRRAS